MSHYTVLVIDSNGNDTVDEQLEPFAEYIEVNPYVTDHVSDEEWERFRNFYTNKENCDKHPTVGFSYADAKLNKNKSNKDLYALYGESWNSNSWQLLEDGDWVEMSTYNPKSKWDWYIIGGRWKGMLVAKNPALAEVGESGTFGNGPTVEDGVDQTTKGNIDWDAMRDTDKFDDALRFWELYVDGQEPKNDKDREMLEHVFYKKEYFTERYKDRETYARCMTEFSTYAVLKDGEWMEQGEMGWFGTSGADPVDELEFQLNFQKNVIEPLNDNALITVVDCHI